MTCLTPLRCPLQSITEDPSPYNDTLLYVTPIERTHDMTGRRKLDKRGGESRIDEKGGEGKGSEEGLGQAS